MDNLSGVDEESFMKMLHSWPYLVLAGLIGALIGFIFSIARVPVYESRVVLGVNINYGVTQSLELVIENRAVDRVAAYINSDLVLQQVLDGMPQQSREERGWNTPADLRENAIISRRLSEWDLIVRDEKPEIAMQTAQLWAKIAVNGVQDAIQHSWKAVGLMNEEQFEVECNRISEENPLIRCMVLPMDLDEDALNGALQNELALSHGILPNIRVEVLQRAELPESPVIWGRNLLIVAGAAASIIITIIIMFFACSKSNSGYSKPNVEHFRDEMESDD
jgi:capsular polysaccharide biosynthesis protein